MRKALLAVALVMALAIGAQAGSIYLAPSALTVSVGATFTIDVVVSGAQAPGAESCNVEVYFDPSLVHALGASEGSFYSSQLGSEMFFTFGYLMDNTAGVLSYTFTRFGPLHSTGSGTAAVLTFECQANGLTTMDYFAVVSDPDGGDLLAATGVVDVQQGEAGPPIPEPMTLVLVGAAVTALGVVARKRS